MKYWMLEGTADRIALGLGTKGNLDLTILLLDLGLISFPLCSLDGQDGIIAWTSGSDQKALLYETNYLAEPLKSFWL